jgi:hypothetical protein
MAVRVPLELDGSRRAELEHVRDHDPLAYMRERAAALLKIADGWSAHAVARRGLLKPRDPDSVYTWLERYREGGVAGLRIHAGRGRKPSFPPSGCDGG